MLPTTTALSRIAVTGSIATDHLVTFAGLFSEQLLPDQLDNLSVVFLADSLEVRRGGTGANIAFGMGVLSAIRQLVEGAAYLFTNEYEAGLVAAKTGWDDSDILELVGIRVTTHGAKGCVISRKGEPDLHVDIVPATAVADPTGVGDAFRAGF